MTETESSDLSLQAEERITEVVRSLADDHVDRGVDLNRPMRCDSCDVEKSPFGSSQYGAYALCNDCLLEFTLALANGDVENVAGYMTKRPEDSEEPPHASTKPSLLEPRPLRSDVRTRGEKLMPSKEPC